MKPKETLSSMFLLINSLALFTVTRILLRDLLSEVTFYETLAVLTVFYTSLSFSAVVGATLLREKMQEKTFLFRWVLLGTCIYFLFPVIIIGKALIHLTVMTFVLGTSIGIGIPTCLSFFAHYIDIKNRGLVGATVFCSTQLLTVLIYGTIGDLRIEEKLLTAGIWRLLGIAGVFFYTPSEIPNKEREQRSFSLIMSERAFILYFFPWLLFCLINFIESPLIEQFLGVELFNTYLMIGIIISSISAFLGGIVCDLKGRKIASIVSFVLLGISYAVLSIFQGIHFSIYAFMLLEGVAWGILYVIFVFVIWADLSEKATCESYYLLGSMPYLLSSWIEILAKPLAELIPISASFSLASFFLFLAVVPLMFAPETLPEQMLRERELRGYIEKAKRVREKFTKG